MDSWRWLGCTTQGLTISTINIIIALKADIMRGNMTYLVFSLFDRVFLVLNSFISSRSFLGRTLTSPNWMQSLRNPFFYLLLTAIQRGSAQQRSTSLTSRRTHQTRRMDGSAQIIDRISVKFLSFITVIDFT